MALEILTYLFAGCGLGSMVLAARSVPSVPGALVRRRPLVGGSALLVGGCAIMALAAWSTREDVHYDDFGSAMTLLVAMAGGALSAGLPVLAAAVAAPVLAVRVRRSAGR